MRTSGSSWTATRGQAERRNWPQQAAADGAGGSAPSLLRGWLQHRNWPQRLRLEEPARKGRQDERRETDHDGIDQQARIANHPGLVQPVADEKEDMSEGSGGERHAHDLAAVRPANRGGVKDPDGQRNKQEGGAP